MGIKHVRIMYRLITWNVDIWNHSLVKARYTHVRDNNEHFTSTKQVYHMSNIIFSPPKLKSLLCGRELPLPCRLFFFTTKYCLIC